MGTEKSKLFDVVVEATYALRGDPKNESVKVTAMTEDSAKRRAWDILLLSGWTPRSVVSCKVIY